MDLWADMLQWAVHTPSPHNVQPWKFKIHDDCSASLFIDRSRMLPKEDLTGSFILSAMTMMTESLVLLAANRKQRLTVELTYKGQDEPLIPFAELRLEPDDSVVGEYPDILFTQRRTSRLRYDKRPITAADFQRLGQLVSAYGVQLGHTEDPAVIERLLDRNIEALFHDLNEPDYHGEISGYFRCSDEETSRSPDGLDFRCMNLLRSELWVCKRAPHLLKIPLLKEVFKYFYRSRLGPVGTIGWLSGPFWKTEEGLAAGKPLIRFWLETARLGLYFHPLGNLVTNPEAFQQVTQAVKAEKIWLIFKIGYSQEPPLSVRLPVEQLLLR